ncbi:LysM peptidoglycan-binding domain-containing protein [Streptomyces sp. AV19]|uniref:LysM peptidoglycan-binding domain-containing protein n=1 Tax=Streptomyces sp. AV19 TaxID=2793068 RepID=UPI0018FEDBDB|nr:LysM peptidoglycan-binding domain-containing protein [Streptomyces sp. AV19]MBH1939184.1 LysM peptidoglycan-binding domain-containing protein [Streptomyces sp. AV19]MDG4536914.1 LysM peptidoglycan-binding domain-containing protein [Streptomyces sp. AV19]
MTPTAEPGPSVPHRAHVVIGSESLAAIAGQLGNPSGWREIAELNGIDDPTRVCPGRLLMLPAGVKSRDDR